MEMSAEVRKDLDRLREDCELLYKGYREKVDYTVAVAYHRGDCKHYSKSTLPKNDCECPVVDEKRARHVKRSGLLDQLKEFAQNKDTDRNPKAERGAPRVKVAGRPPGDMGGFFALDEITGEITMFVDRWLEENHLNRTWAAERDLHDCLEGLPRLAGEVEVAMMIGGDDGGTGAVGGTAARSAAVAAAAWVAAARRVLRITVADGAFEGTVCGNCGGALSSPWGNRGESDVRCIGSPGEAPCGESYPPSEWIKLYEGRVRDLGSRS